MRVEYEAQGGWTTERIRVDLTPQEADALADLHDSLFVGKDDHLATGPRRIATEWKLDQDAALFETSVPNGGHVTALAPISSEGRSE